MKIYTRSGDTGQASLYNGERLYKDDAVFQALGDVDELNSALGVAMSFLTDKTLLEQVNNKGIGGCAVDSAPTANTPVQLLLWSWIRMEV